MYREVSSFPQKGHACNVAYENNLLCRHRKYSVRLSISSSSQQKLLLWLVRSQTQSLPTLHGWSCTFFDGGLQLLCLPRREVVMAQRVLVVNTGSSSLKFKLYDLAPSLHSTISGLLERIGEPSNSTVTIKVSPVFKVLYGKARPTSICLIAVRPSVHTIVSCA